VILIWLKDLYISLNTEFIKAVSVTLFTQEIEMRHCDTLSLLLIRFTFGCLRFSLLREYDSYGSFNIIEFLQIQLLL
jgi:hypothetical protein